MDSQDNDDSTRIHVNIGGDVSGNLNVAGGNISITTYKDIVHRQGATREDFVAALQELLKQVENAQGLDDNTRDDLAVELERARKAAERDTPDPERIESCLEQAKSILDKVMGTVQAAAALAPMIAMAIDFARQVFGG